MISTELKVPIIESVMSYFYGFERDDGIYCSWIVVYLFNLSFVDIFYVERVSLFLYISCRFIVIL